MGYLLLVVGVLLWWGAHLFKRIMPDARARMGDPGKGYVAIGLLISVVVMVVGYRIAPFTPVYTPPAWGQHANNLLMLIAVILFGMGSSKGYAKTWLRHPMLTGFLLWAVAHLLANGDMASVILFGGLGLWAPVAMVLVNRARGPWTPPAPGTVWGDIRLVAISLVVFAIIGFVHEWLGPAPFPL